MFDTSRPASRPLTSQLMLLLCRFQAILEDLGLEKFGHFVVVGDMGLGKHLQISFFLFVFFILKIHIGNFELLKNVADFI